MTDATGRLLRLGDGRRLGYADIGDAAGTPVIWCHGGLSSRLDAQPGDAAAQALGVRLIAPDRPGVGSSERLPGRTLLDWPTDVAELADALEIERFAVLGWSLGGPFAAACAFALPDRAAMLGLVAPCIPADWEGMEAALSRIDRRLLRETRVGSTAARFALTVMRLTAARAPRMFTRAAARGLSGQARESLTGQAGTWLPTAVTEGLRDPNGVLDDYRIMGAPWGFEPAGIVVPTRIWQGDADTLVPPSWAKRLGAAIGGATVTMVEGEGHYLAADRFDEILAAAIGDPRAL
jgi:pimeloyl-ACP methyl ester carboxylesterase